MPNLQKLLIFDNQLASIESGRFAELTNLQRLALHSNQIASIESGAFSGLGSLRHLFLESNSLSELNLTEATFFNLEPCVTTRSRPGKGFCANKGNEITSLTLDDAVLSRESFDAIVSETASITDVSLVGLQFSEANPDDLSQLLGISSLDHVTVDQGLFSLYEDELDAFADVDGNTLTIAPSLSGDFDLDGDVDSADRTVLTQNWTGALMSGEGDRMFGQGDVDGDGDVDTADATFLAQSWTGALMATRLDQPVVPEPSGIVMLLPILIAGAWVARRRCSPNF